MPVPGLTWAHCLIHITLLTPHTINTSLHSNEIFQGRPLKWGSQVDADAGDWLGLNSIHQGKSRHGAMTHI